MNTTQFTSITNALRHVVTENAPTASDIVIGNKSRVLSRAGLFGSGRVRAGFGPKVDKISGLILPETCFCS